jgi:hypothetical protein
MFEDILDYTEQIFVEPADYSVFTAYILKEFKDFKSVGKDIISI